MQNSAHAVTTISHPWAGKPFQHTANTHAAPLFPEEGKKDPQRGPSAVWSRRDRAAGAQAGDTVLICHWCVGNSRALSSNAFLQQGSPQAHVFSPNLRALGRWTLHCGSSWSSCRHEKPSCGPDCFPIHAIIGPAAACRGELRFRNWLSFCFITCFFFSPPNFAVLVQSHPGASLQEKVSTCCAQCCSECSAKSSVLFSEVAAGHQGIIKSKNSK